MVGGEGSERRGAAQRMTEKADAAGVDVLLDTLSGPESGGGEQGRKIRGYGFEVVDAGSDALSDKSGVSGGIGTASDCIVKRVDWR